MSALDWLFIGQESTRNGQEILVGGFDINSLCYTDASVFIVKH